MPRSPLRFLHGVAIMATLVSPVWAKGFPWKGSLIATQGPSVVSLAKDGKTQWQATFDASGPLEIIPDSKAPWLAYGDRVWAFDPTQGKEVWRLKLDGPAVFPPQPASDHAWAVSWKAKDDWKIALIAKSDGQQLWSQSFSAKPEILSDDEATPLIIKSGDELVALGPDSKPLWSAKQPRQRCWVGKDQILVLQDRDFSCLSRSSGKLLWQHHALPIPKVSGEERGLEVAFGPPFVAIQDLANQTLTCLRVETGQKVWENPGLPSIKIYLGWVGPYLVHRVLENVEVLRAETGKPLHFVVLNTFTTQGLMWQNHILLLGRFSLQEPSLDEKGRPITEIVSKIARKEPVDGFVSHLDGVPFISDIRSPGRMEALGDTLIFSTKTKPARVEGAPLKIDPAAPEAPLILHGWNSPQQETWKWAPSRTAERAKWKVVNGHLILFHQDGTLSELNPKTGERVWKSPRLSEGDSEPRLIFDDGGIWVESDGNRISYLGSDGRILAAWDLRPIFDSKKTVHLISLLLLIAAIGFYIVVARQRKLFIRKIAGLDAIDEAVGRATEMGRPVLYVPGLEDIDEIQTLASLSILSHVAKRTAEYDTEILVPTRRAVVMSTAQEVVKEAYTLAGRPDAFISDNIRYLTDDQFGFVAGVDGIMMREKPAANFYMGMFYGEALILAETGFATGAIQIAGTAAPSQLPFFVATCDYTLLGEELYAASAYLSQDPLQVGSLRGQDLGKAMIMGTMVAGTLLHSCGIPLIKALFK